MSQADAGRRAGPGDRDTELVLQAPTRLFAAPGASALWTGLSLERCRNGRPIASYDPRIYRDRIVEAFAVTGATRPRRCRVGMA